MTTPGTPEWLKATAEALKKETGSGELAEGLIRAAHRIVRLQGELSKLKTGVDQTHKPAPPPRFPTARQLTVMAQRELHGNEHVKIALPDSEVHEAVFDWVNDSEFLGTGVLDACTLVLAPEDPQTFRGDEPLPPPGHGAPRLQKLLPARLRQAGVWLQSEEQCIELEDCRLLDAEERDGVTILEFVAKSQRIVERI